MIRFSILFSMLFLATGCGGGGTSSPPVLTEAYLEVPPSTVAPSPSDGQPISNAQLHPQDVPAIQCPHDNSGPGLVICHVAKGNQIEQTTLCILWAHIPAHQNHSADYLGVCH